MEFHTKFAILFLSIKKKKGEVNTNFNYVYARKIENTVRGGRTHTKLTYD